MKMNLRKLTVALCATLVFFVAPSCSDENKETDYIGGDDSEIEVKPAKYSDFKLYSGKTMLATVYGSSQVNVNGNQWYLNWERPVNITRRERVRVVEEFSKPRPDSVNHIHVTWKNFWVQQVYKGTTEYVDGWGSNIGKGSDQMNVLQVFTNLKKEVVSWWPYQDTLYVYDGDYLHINNFNSGNNTTVYTDDVTGISFFCDDSVLCHELLGLSKSDLFACAHEVLDELVLKRVVGDDHEPSSGLENADGLLEHLPERVHLVVDFDSEGLERLRHVFLHTLTLHERLENRHQLLNPADRLVFPRLDDGIRHPPAVFQLSIDEEDVGYPFLIVGVDHLRRIKIPVDVQPHVKLLLTLEAEAPA